MRGASRHCRNCAGADSPRQRRALPGARLRGRPGHSSLDSGSGAARLSACAEESIPVASFASRIDVGRAPGGAVTQPGQQSLFADLPKQADLFDAFVVGTPLAHASRSAHVNVTGQSGVAGHVPGAQPCSDGSVRHAIAGMDGAEAEAWLRRQLDHFVRTLPEEPRILDIDTTVRPVGTRHAGWRQRFQGVCSIGGGCSGEALLSRNVRHVAKGLELDVVRAAEHCCEARG